MRIVATTLGQPSGGQYPKRDLSAAGGFSPTGDEAGAGLRPQPGAAYRQCVRPFGDFSRTIFLWAKHSIF
jgi:hypothetical protein